MALNDWEFSYNGMTFGKDNAIGVLDISGLTDMPNVRDDTTEIVARHGAFDYSQYYEPRYVTIHGDVSSAAIHTSIATLRQALLPQSSLLALKFKLPNEVEKQLWCRPLRLSFPIDRDYMIGYTDWVAQLIAPDPIIYATAGSTLNIDASSGWGTGNAANNGVEKVWPVMTLTGPGTGWYIENNAGGNFKWGGSLTSGQTCVIDLKNRTVLKEGVNDYGNVDFDYSTWWQLSPGNNGISVSFDSGNGAGSQVDLAWNNGY